MTLRNAVINMAKNRFKLPATLLRSSDIYGLIIERVKKKTNDFKFCFENAGEMVKGRDRG